MKYILGHVTRLHIVDTTLHADIKSECPERIIGRYTRGEGITERNGDRDWWELVRISVGDTPIGMHGLVTSLFDVPVCSVRNYGSFEVTMKRMLSMVNNFSRRAAEGYLPPVSEVALDLWAYEQVMGLPVEPLP